MTVVRIDREGEIAIVTVDNPPVNALGQALRQGLWDAVSTLDADASVRAVVLICAGRTFIAGADVTEFGKPPVPPNLPDLVDRIEGAVKPWVAAIHGSALGGGFEVAMGCQFRVALESASVGLPEVGLGIVPGASGTVRTPRLAGVPAAVELVTKGRPVKAAKAQAMGLVDAVVSGDLRTGAVEFVRAALTVPLPLPVSARPVVSPDPAWWDDQRLAIAARAKGEIAPLRALDCLRMAAERPFAEALAHERATFLDLRGSEQALALRHVFFAERAAPRPAHLGAAKPLPMASIAVLGGTADILAALRKADVPGVVTDPDDTALAGCDLVIVGANDARIARLGRLCRPDSVLAVMGLAPNSLPNPARCVGLNPIGAAVEIAPTPETTAETLATAFALARSLGLLPVQTGAGSISQRLLRRFQAETAMLGQGVGAALRDHSFAGALAVQDFAPTDPQMRTTEVIVRLTSAMADEGLALLAEGIALSATDIDLIAIHGLGYPRWRGGPMFEHRARNA
ncbi:MAG: 3-hydroxyacyl-CoA dehydrogenase [Rhodobacteraceae bacterium PARR1]|nr:MAG: 3-hydroxyacyl-CoA dehydrogenase [Rhodobacteraceae bacterium PARR1]